MTSSSPTAPGRLTVELIADKWTAVVLYGLSEGPVRHGELVELVGSNSRKVLTQTLRRLESHGLSAARRTPRRHRAWSTRH